MKNIKTICLLSLFLSASQITQAQISEQNTSNEKETEIEKKIRLIPTSHINLINMIFMEAPLYTLKIQAAYRKSQQILKEFDLQTDSEIKAFNKKYNTKEKIKALVSQRQEDILKPVKELFPLLHLKEYRFINEPLFVNMLIEEKTQNEIKLKTKKDKVSIEDIYKYMNLKDIPIGLKFLNSNKEKAQTFFKDYIIDKETLITCCGEFTALFGPFNKILTQKTKDNAVQYYKALISKRRK